jgi:hypothetical protein
MPTPTESCLSTSNWLVSVRSYGGAVPEISRFYGIVITLNFDDHLPPHFHARYGEFRASMTFDGEILDGRLPPRAVALIRVWAKQHQGELRLDWGLARRLQPLVPIAPLD